MQTQKSYVNIPIRSVHKYRARGNPNRICVLVEAESRSKCEIIVTELKTQHPDSTFTEPEKADNGQFVAYGHYMEKDNNAES